MMRLTPGLLALAVVTALGCSGVRVPPSTGLVPTEVVPTQAERLVVRARALAVAGDGRAAQYLYQRVVREFPGDPAAAGALYALGRLSADPASGLRDYRAAHAAFSQLLAEYPESRWAPDARAWQATLGELLAREDEATRVKLQLRWREAEAAELRGQVQQLRKVDLDLERRR